MESFPRDLLKELECPVCLELMLPPISQCENGHNICNKCKPDLLSCPTCRGKFTTVRNITAENLSRMAKVACRFRTSGCLEEVSLEAKMQHEEQCCFGLCMCPFYIVGDCCWEGNMKKMRDHIRHNHADSVKKTVYGSMKAELKWNTGIVVQGGQCCQAMLMADEVFFKYTLLVESTLYMCVMHVASEESETYKYKMTLTTTDGSECITARLKCPNYKKFILQKSLVDKCMAVFHTNFATRCINAEGKLCYEIEILK